MADKLDQSRREVARRSVVLERATGLVERGLELAAAVFDSTFVAASTGILHSIALRRDGSLWAWGMNEDGQLGLGDVDDRDRPTRIGCDNDWAAVSTGWKHALALKRDGSLWAWGRNAYGQLGVGDTVDRDRPTTVGGDSDWQQLAGSSQGIHALALKRGGSLWAWGPNDCGSLGLGDNEDRDRPTRVVLTSSLGREDYEL